MRALRRRIILFILISRSIGPSAQKAFFSAAAASMGQDNSTMNSNMGTGPGLLQRMMGLQAPDAVRNPIYAAALARRNTPHGVEEHMARRTEVSRLTDDSKGWVVDRILEPQTVSAFVEFLVSGALPGSGARTGLALPTREDVAERLMKPYSTWAQAGSPLQAVQEAVVGQVMVHIGSYEDDARLHCATKALHAMKSRAWEAVPPVSERRWREKRLDEPAQFDGACQLMSGVVNVFHYLNTDYVREALRDTYNLVYDRFETFDAAVNQLRAAESPPRDPVSVAALWAEFMRHRHDVMVNTAYNWVTEHVERLRRPILEALKKHQPEEEGEAYDETQWKLTNKLHDLVEIRAHADYAIFMPTDGYKGAPAATKEDKAQVEAQASGMQPLVYTDNTEDRHQRYVMRLKALSRERVMQTLFQELAAAAGTGGRVSKPANAPSEVWGRSNEQVEAQHQAALELRGEKVVYEKPGWVRDFDEDTAWGGYVVYRVGAETSDEEWEEFKTKFEADTANWGEELPGVEEVKKRSTFHYVNARQQWRDGTIDALKKHWAGFVNTDPFPDGFEGVIFLVADEHTIQSYIDPLPESVPPGDNGPSILLVDSSFDAETEDIGESPGYNGQMRILTSLLWDELALFTFKQSYRPMEMWPLASAHPWGVYVGPVTPLQAEKWQQVIQLKLGGSVDSFGKWGQRMLQ